MTNIQSVEKWQSRLEETFFNDRCPVNEHFTNLLISEKEHPPECVERNAGFMTLIESLQRFYIGTYAEAIRHPYTKNANTWSLLHATFKRLRSNLILFVHGYPYEAASGIRPIAENSFFLGAVLNGHIKHNDLFSFLDGIDLKKLPFRKLEKLRENHLQKITRTINDKMRGYLSGLSDTDQQSIASIMRLLHGHIHRTETTFIDTYVEMIASQSPPSLLSLGDDRASNHFASEMVNIAWIMLRVVPYFSNPLDYSDDWKNKYQVLDNSFMYYVRATNGKHWEAYTRMVDKVFTFKPEASWPRVDGRIQFRSATPGKALRTSIGVR